ncbi:uncharacterized protein LOC106474605 isoform X2 [Limulus polyphemus]|uniref:Uncharacterized protein LOC106474605 isoform X2 n=1 Tax=Limulus polyphemus TaxID=6850 RepID=A0ABM1TRW9_LIMPO|nr:uncharacterized protein LOC106474605 isoform X2 [Limulus polyphemus]
MQNIASSFIRGFGLSSVSGLGVSSSKLTLKRSNQWYVTLNLPFKIGIHAKNSVFSSHSVSYSTCKSKVSSVSNSLSNTFIGHCKNYSIGSHLRIYKNMHINPNLSLATSDVSQLKANVQKNFGHRFISTSSLSGCSQKTESSDMCDRFGNSEQGNTKCVKHILEKDVELQSILEDINDDFEGPSFHPQIDKGVYEGRNLNSFENECYEQQPWIACDFQENDFSDIDITYLFSNQVFDTKCDQDETKERSFASETGKIGSSSSHSCCSKHEPTVSADIRVSTPDSIINYDLFHYMGEICPLGKESQQGVLDIIRKNLEEMSVIEIPKSLKHIDYLILGTTSSPQQLDKLITQVQVLQMFMPQ